MKHQTAVNPIQIWLFRWMSGFSWNTKINNHYSDRLGLQGESYYTGSGSIYIKKCFFWNRCFWGNEFIIRWTYPFMPIFFTRIKKISECRYWGDKLPLKWDRVIFCYFDWRLWGNFEILAGVKGMILPINQSLIIVIKVIEAKW